jgi:hypothetical protein
VKKISLRDLALLNVFFGALLILFAAAYVWGSLSYAKVANEHVSKPELIPNAVYEQGKCEKLKEVAVSCYKLQDEMFVTSLRATVSNAREMAGAAVGLAALLFLNAWIFRMLAKVNEESRSNT